MFLKPLKIRHFEYLTRVLVACLECVMMILYTSPPYQLAAVWALLSSWCCLDPVGALQSNMELVYWWRLPDFAWKSRSQRLGAVRAGTYRPEHALPFGLEVAGDRVFLSYGSFRAGSPATLAVVPRVPQGTRSPALQPYPSWDWHVSTGKRLSRLNCDRTLLGVVRVRADGCGRLWAIDSGRYAFIPSVFMSPAQCPMKLVVFDLITDKPVRIYHLPADQYKWTSTVTALAVDTSSGCNDTFAYWADSLGRFIGVYSWKSNSSWTFRHLRFSPDVNRLDAMSLNVKSARFPMPDGVYQVTLPAAANGTKERIAYWHSLTSFEENSVPLDVLRDPKSAPRGRNFTKIGDRGATLGQKVVGAVDSRGVMFYSLANLDAVACWNTRQPYRPDTQAVLSHGLPGTLYPSGLSIVPSRGNRNHGDEEVWLLSSAGLRASIPFLFRVFPNDYNVLVHRAAAKDLSEGSVCTVL